MSNEPRPRPRFLGEPPRRFFTLQFLPQGEPRAHIVYLPPFAEEMNRCRTLVADQARILAAAGYACTLIDFFGTGDSEGELVDATFALWHENIAVTLRTLRQEADIPVYLWGLRLGALVGLDFATRTGPELAGFILWQPVVNPGVFVNQMLRQRVAMLSMRGLPAETTADIRARLDGGEAVEIAGYTVSGALVRDMEAVSLEDMRALTQGRIHWLEHVLEQGRDIGPASQRAVDKLRSRDNQVDVHTFAGPQIWQVANRERAPELLAITGGLLP